MQAPGSLVQSFLNLIKPIAHGLHSIQNQRIFPVSLCLSTYLFLYIYLFLVITRFFVFLCLFISFLRKHSLRLFLSFPPTYMNLVPRCRAALPPLFLYHALLCLCLCLFSFTNTLYILSIALSLFPSCMT